MEHSDKFEKVKRYYDMKMWNVGRVRNAVIKDWITEQEYEDITRRNLK